MLLNYGDQLLAELCLVTVWEYTKWQRPEQFRKAKNLRKKTLVMALKNSSYCCFNLLV